jgi:alanine racemase
MSVKANIVYIKKVPPGFSVSYGRHFVTGRESLIATLPIGYEDGLPRTTFGKSRIIVRGHYAPIVGTICMDLCMADVTDVPGVKEYDEVILIGEQNGKRISAEEIAKNSDTIAYEVVCRFGLRMPRKYV